MENKEIKKSVLIIENDHIVFDKLSTHLKSKGFNLLKSNNAHQALEIIREYSPDIILLDHGGPVDDVNFFHKLNLRIPILLMGNFGLSDKINNKYKVSGIHDYIHKPISTLILDIKMERLLLRSKDPHKYWNYLIESAKKANLNYLIEEMSKAKLRDSQ